MKELHDHFINNNRRNFLKKTGLCIGGLALGSLINPFQREDKDPFSLISNQLNLPNYAPKAKRIIYLFQSGGPSQNDLFDYKPKLSQMKGIDLPESVRMGQRLTGMTSGQSRFPLVGSSTKFRQYGEARAWVSDLMPYIGKISDELCFIKSMHTEAINHDPAVTFFQTGSQQPGRPSMGSWLSYGLGSLNKNLPSFVVLLSRGTGRPKGQPLYSRLWGNGFLSSLHQGVQFRSAKDPVLFLKDPESLSKSERRKMLDYLSELNEEQERKFGDKEVSNRISQYEMAYRMQTSVPETMDISDEPESILKLYGPNANILMSQQFYETDNSRDFVRGYGLHSGRFTTPMTYALGGYGTDKLIPWGSEHRKIMNVLNNMFKLKFTKTAKKSRSNIIIAAIYLCINPSPKIKISMAPEVYVRSNLESLKSNTYYNDMFTKIAFQN